ncbi:1-acyl-sn-glycerol-3-phosphate acyltransferase [Lewinella sp. JB7]|uniref:1-acyl-sn-glycerol-3-phosphate acyltransferase n=1 Tax=Lewinella sp. JB7 TaxID=2962887 RepID=UPI0020C96B82|nr:1-acyl-sn-glycerol-3-phosphate acyltransferase [Lewinella sp. JB7]MCP9235866.1 1-acyl-sn-glycerol-3-phosphate acyltransferase [Lewinella sp. JB7]
MMPAWLARLLLRLNGMRVVDHNDGNWPDKCVVPTGPHTSNRDFPYGLYARAAVGKYIQFVAKSTLFRGPVGAVMQWTGGVPVVREKRTNFTQAVVKLFEEREKFYLCIAMEGTRKKVDRFRTGFYWIAREARVPMVFAKFDFGNRVIEFSKPFYPSGDVREDFDFIYRHFDGVKGLEPKNSFEYDPAVLEELPAGEGSTQIQTD